MGIYSSNSLFKDNDVTTVTVEAQTYSESLEILETGFMIVEENEKNWNALMKAVGLQELSCLESTGEEMVYTEAAKNEFVSGVVAFFKRAFAKIKGLFEKFIAKITSLVRSDEVFVKNYEAKILEGAKNIPDTLKFKGYEFPGLDKFYLPTKDVFEVNDKLSRILSDLEISPNENYELETDKIASTIEDWENSTKEEKLDEIRGSLIPDNNGAVSSKEFSSKLKESLLGEKKELGKSYLSNASDFIKEIKEAKETKNKAKEDFEALRENINKAIKEMKNYEGEGNDEELKSVEVKAAHLVADYFKAQLAIYTKANSVHLDCLKKRNRQCKAICVKLVGYAVSQPQPKASAQNSSANYFQSEKPVTGIELV